MSRTRRLKQAIDPPTNHRKDVRARSAPVTLKDFDVVRQACCATALALDVLVLDQRGCGILYTSHLIWAVSKGKTHRGHWESEGCHTQKWITATEGEASHWFGSSDARCQGERRKALHRGRARVPLISWWECRSWTGTHLLGDGSSVS